MDATKLARSLKLNNFKRLVKAGALPRPEQGKYYSHDEIKQVLILVTEYDSWLTQTQMADVLGIDISHFQDVVYKSHIPAPTHRKGNMARLHYAPIDVAKVKTAYQTYRARLDSRPDNPCSRCRHREATEGYKTCECCRLFQKERAQLRKQHGLCRHCSHQAAKGHTCCEPCLERMRQREAKKRHQNKSCTDS